MIDRPFIIEILEDGQINMWLTSVHIYILNDKHINSNSGGHNTIDQSALILNDDVIAAKK